MSKMIGVGKITDAGTAKRITDIFEHVKGRGPEVSAKMAESWSVEVSNTGMPGKPVNPAFSADPVLRVRRGKEVIAEFSVGRPAQSVDGRGPDTPNIKMTVFPEGASTEHLERLLKGVETSVQADKVEIANAARERKQELDKIFGELDL